MFLCLLASFLALKGGESGHAEILVIIFGIFGVLEVMIELMTVASLMGVR